MSSLRQHVRRPLVQAVPVACGHERVAIHPQRNARDQALWITAIQAKGAEIARWQRRLQSILRKMTIQSKMRFFNIRIESCMDEFPVRTPEQLPGLLQGFRKQAGFTQAEVASRLGITQQTLSSLERNATAVSAARLMKLLGILGVEFVLRRPSSMASRADSPATDASKAQW